MGKNIQFREFDKNADVEIWAIRINKLMMTRKVNQQELAKACDISPSVISDYVGIRKKDSRLRTPKVDKLQKIAKYFGVSVDYLLGENECETPSDEKIHEITGLSGLAIQNLRAVNGLKNESIEAEKKGVVLNYLLENLTESSLFESLYDYLIADFAFPGREDDQFGAFMIERLPSGRQSRNVVFKEMLSESAFTRVQHDIMRIKDRILEERAKEQEKNIEEK